MMQEYCKTKEQYKDCILFYRLGDFYEMFFDDALLVTRELEITLTGKDCGFLLHPIRRNTFSKKGSRKTAFFHVIGKILSR